MVSRAWKTKCLHLPRCAADHARHVRLAEAAQNEEHERLALVLGETGEVPDQLVQIGASPGVVRETVASRLEILGRHDRVPASRQEVRQRLRAIVNSQGRTRVGHPACLERAVRAQEGLLQHVFGILAVAQHVATEGQEGSPMAVVEPFEGSLVAAGCQRGEPPVVEDASAGEITALALEVAMLNQTAAPGRLFL